MPLHQNQTQQQPQTINKHSSQKSLFTYLSEPNRRSNKLPTIDENKPIAPTGNDQILRKYTKYKKQRQNNNHQEENTSAVGTAKKKYTQFRLNRFFTT